MRGAFFSICAALLLCGVARADAPAKEASCAACGGCDHCGSGSCAMGGSCAGGGCCDMNGNGGSCAMGAECASCCGAGGEEGAVLGPLHPLHESRLEPGDHMERLPPNWTGDIDYSWWNAWIADRRQLHGNFLQPLVLPSVFPDFEVKLENVMGYHKAARAADLDQFAILSAYWVEVYVPLLTLRDSTPVSAGSFRVNLKAPWVLNRHNAVTLFFGADIPVEGTLTATGTYNAMIGYAFGSTLFSAQARAGLGDDRLIGTSLGGRDPSFLWDAAVAVRPIKWVQVIAEADGRKVIGANRAEARLWPAVRVFPACDSTFSVGVGGMFWFAETGGDWSSHRPGGVVDVAYMFL